ncbi:ribosomal RNA small subunit methyltransferase, chloroplastic isoform X2 [Dendrobium catenatum]|uniref:ribosomal RNA small subunit methyltransferase, chloroplastic isoform X2 n=1 Tax=Dendrobium catenatum TaxID=906689 RepID=UPI00109FCA94|nr:ribosomal RNA small subunit methyltransferase, chloroplastic isoform X2 [Dendrobium catenatum]
MVSPAALSLRPSFPPPSNACQSRLRSPSFAVAVKGGKRGEDDYHSTLKALNSRGRIVPRKSLGQHYMLNSSINDQLSSIAGVVEGDVVLEIGPGTGSLTNVLINAGATVIAIEKDPRMALMVKERFGCSDQLTILQEDITRCHIRSHVSALLERVDTNGLKYAKVVSNIPFNISTDVVKQLLPMGDLFSEVIILLQDEAALRLVGFQLHSSEYRPINLFVNFYSDAEYICKVERTNFFPQPNVNSAFNGKRKMLRKSLQHICSAPKIEDALREVGLQETARPQELTLEDFVRLYNLLSKTDQSIPQSVIQIQ